MHAKVRQQTHSWSQQNSSDLGSWPWRRHEPQAAVGRSWHIQGPLVRQMVRRRWEVVEEGRKLECFGKVSVLVYHLQAAARSAENECTPPELARDLVCELPDGEGSEGWSL